VFESEQRIVPAKPEFPDPAKNSLFARKNSLFFWSQGIGLQRIEITTKSPGFADSREFDCNALKSQRESAPASAESAANPEKFPVKFPVLREFEDRGPSSTGRTARYDSNAGNAAPVSLVSRDRRKCAKSSRRELTPDRRGEIIAVAKLEREGVAHGPGPRTGNRPRRHRGDAQLHRR
jgi:hypothetical protein